MMQPPTKTCLKTMWIKPRWSKRKIRVYNPAVMPSDLGRRGQNTPKKPKAKFQRTELGGVFLGRSFGM